MSRYRHESFPNPPAVLKSKIIENGVVSLDQTTEFPREPERTRGTTDEVIPRYAERSAKGEVFNNPYRCVRTSFSSEGSYAASAVYDSPSWKASSTNTGSNGWYLQDAMNSGMEFPSVVLEDTMSAVSKAQIQAQSKINATDFDAGVFFAEWAKTKVLHTQLGDAIVRLVKAARKSGRGRPRFKKTPVYDAKGNPLLNSRGRPIYRYLHDDKLGKAYSGGLKAPVDSYLLYRFGITPLLHDLDGAMKIMSNLHTPRKTARGDYEVRDSKTVTTTVPWMTGNITITLTTHKILQIRAGILYDTTITGEVLARLGLTRPASMIWELIPLSFVVDRFVRVGEWLDAVQPSGSYRNLAAWVTRTEQEIHTATAVASINTVSGPSTYNLELSEGLTRVLLDKRRDPWLPSLPKLPSLRPGFQPQHAVDYAALLAQRLRR